MAVSANIKFTQGATTDIAGRSVIGATGSAVTLSNGNDSEAYIWTWTLLDAPSTSALAPGVLASGTSAASASFTPDVTGSYRIKLVVSDINGVTATQTRVFSVLTSRSWLIPSLQSGVDELNFGGNTRGWASYLETALRDIHDTPGQTITTASFTQPAVGSSVAVSVKVPKFTTVGATVYVNGGGSYTVMAIGSTTLTLMNLSSSNTSAGSTIPANSVIVHSGKPSVSPSLYAMPNTAQYAYTLQNTSSPGATLPNEGALGTAGDLTISGTPTSPQWGAPSPVGPMGSQLGVSYEFYRDSVSFSSFTSGVTFEALGRLELSGANTKPFIDLNGGSFTLGMDNSNFVFFKVTNAAASTASASTGAGYNQAYTDIAHFMGTWDLTTIKLYINGVLVTSTAFSGSMFATASRLRLLRQTSGTAGYGAGVRFAVHNAVLTQSYAQAVTKAAKGWS